MSFPETMRLAAPVHLIELGALGVGNSPALGLCGAVAIYMEPLASVGDARCPDCAVMAGALPGFVEVHLL